MDYTKLYKIENDGRGFAKNITETLLQKGADDLYMKYVIAKIPEFLSDIYFKAFKVIQEETTITHDNGDDLKDIYRFWKEESEPVRPIVKTN